MIKNKPTPIEKDKPKYSGWHCPYGDMQIMMASQKQVNEHLATHKDKSLEALKKKCVIEGCDNVCMSRGKGKKRKWCKFHYKHKNDR